MHLPTLMYFDRHGVLFIFCHDIIAFAEAGHIAGKRLHSAKQLDSREWHLFISLILLQRMRFLSQSTRAPVALMHRSKQHITETT